LNYRKLNCRKLKPCTLKQCGFSLIEIAIGLMIIGLIASSMIASIGQQTEQRRATETKASLNQAKDAVMAYLTTQGRLPCPASATSNGQESILSNSGGIVTCSLEAGFLPGVTLGMTGLDASGNLNNGWDDGAGATTTRPRAFRYSVSNLAAPVANALTSPGLGAVGSSTRRVDVQNAINAGQGLFVCASVSGISGGTNRCGSTANLLSNSAAATIWTMGSNGNDSTTFSADEQQNAVMTIPRVVISRGYAPSGATGGRFDDFVTWIPTSLVLERLFATGVVQ
jgi:prepilin-type N-terminal cleavage/methylation domain-containing protein